MFAVVSSKKSCYTFTKWHETLDDAKAEAKRLVEKEGHPFIILQTVQVAMRTPVPVKFDDSVDEVIRGKE